MAANLALRRRLPARRPRGDVAEGAQPAVRADAADVLDWMLGRGLRRSSTPMAQASPRAVSPAATGPGDRPLDAELRERQASACRPRRVAEFAGARRSSRRRRLLLSAAGVDPTRPIDEQADAFWWNASVTRPRRRPGAARGRRLASVARLVRGPAPPATAAGRQPVLTVTRDRPAVVALDPAGACWNGCEADRTLRLDDLDPRR